MPSDDQLASLNEIKAARNVLEHNAAIVNPVYLEKSGSAARWSLGDRLQITEDYLREVHSLSSPGWPAMCWREPDGLAANLHRGLACRRGWAAWGGAGA